MRALILLRLSRYIIHVLTYLLTLFFCADPLKSQQKVSLLLYLVTLQMLTSVH